MARGLQERPITGEVSAVGLLCPGCDYWTHSYYETPEITGQRAALVQSLETYQKTPAGKKRDQRWVEYQTAKSAFARMFEREQQRLRRKYAGAADLADPSTDVL